MAWIYLTYDDDGDLEEARKMPPQGSICLVFEELRWRLMIGYLDHQEYRWVLDPNAREECVWLAWAPLDEVEALDMDRILRSAGCRPGDEPGADGYRGKGTHHSRPLAHPPELVFLAGEDLGDRQHDDEVRKRKQAREYSLERAVTRPGPTTIPGGAP